MKIQNHLNTRCLKILGIGAIAFISLLIGINKLVQVTTPQKQVTDTLTGETITQVTGESIFQPLLHLVSVGDMAFTATKAIIIAVAILLLLFKNTLGKWLKSDRLDNAFSGFSAAEKTRWSLGALIALIFALIVGAANGATPSSLHVSQKGIDLILKYEVGGGRSYYNKYLTRLTVPAWRTTKSGATGGIGYDCGYNSKSQIARDWNGVIPPSQVRVMQSLSGKKGSTAYYATRSVKHLVHISYDQAEVVFKKSTLPRFSKLTAKAFQLTPDRLHPHCNGALVSLVFNRGGSMGRTSSATAWDTRMEMRWIRHNIATKNEHRVPSNIKHMKRIWSYKKLKGLHLRRDSEAHLFSLGIAA